MKQGGKKHSIKITSSSGINLVFVPNELLLRFYLSQKPSFYISFEKLLNSSLIKRVAEKKNKLIKTKNINSGCTRVTAIGCSSLSFLSRLCE